MLLALLFLFQQTPIQDEPLTLPPIVYPQAARQAHIQGTVSLQIDVDPTGHVTAVHALAGPEALRQAAIDAYSAATYRPILTAGHPTPAIIKTSVNFNLKELPPDTDEQVNKQFAPLHANCQQLSADHAPTAQATCQQAIDISRRFSPTAQLEARVQAYNDLVLLLIAEGKKSPHLREAEALANQSIDLVSGTTVHQPAVATAYITRAEVRSLAGNLKGAAADCTIAEETLQTLLRDEAENDKAASYRGQLRQLIELHALILDRDNKKDQAKLLRQRGTLLE